MRDKNLSDQGHNSYIYQMCKRAPLPTYMRNENVIDKQALEWCSLGMQGGRQVGRSFLVRSCLLITLIKCLKGHKSLGSLCNVVKALIVSGVRPSNQGTMSPIELFWTAKKMIAPESENVLAEGGGFILIFLMLTNFVFH